MTNTKANVIILCTTIIVIMWSIMGLDLGIDWDDLARALHTGGAKNLEETPCVACVSLLK